MDNLFLSQLGDSNGKPVKKRATGLNEDFSNLNVYTNPLGNLLER
jgi:hypothetical protein